MISSQSDEYAIEVENRSAFGLKIAAMPGDEINGRESIALAGGGKTLIEKVDSSGTPVYTASMSQILDEESAAIPTTQYWPRPNNRTGLIYLAHSLYNDKKSILGGKAKDLSVIPNVISKNRGLYRIRRFEHDSDKRVDVISANGVGGGSLFYSGVNLIPENDVMVRLGLDLGETDFQKALRWMTTYRGRINKIVTKNPVPHRPGSRFSFVPDGNLPRYERPDPELRAGRRDEEDYRLTDRSRVLKWALEDAVADGDFSGIADWDEIDPVWAPLPLSVVEYDENRDKQFMSRDFTLLFRRILTLHICQRLAPMETEWHLSKSNRKKKALWRCKLCSATWTVKRNMYRRLLRSTKNGAKQRPSAPS